MTANNNPSNDWKQVLQEMKDVLNDVENDHKSLSDALNRAQNPELRQLLTIALAVLKDGRKLTSAAKAADLDPEYVREHLLPLVEALLEDDDATG